MDPGNAQITDVAGIDLGKLTVMIGPVGTVIGQPVVLTASLNARGVHRLSKAGRSGKRRPDPSSNRRREISRLFLHRHSLRFFLALAYWFAGQRHESRQPLRPSRCEP